MFFKIYKNFENFKIFFFLGLGSKIIFFIRIEIFFIRIEFFFIRIENFKIVQNRPKTQNCPKYPKIQNWSVDFQNIFKPGVGHRIWMSRDLYSISNQEPWPGQWGDPARGGPSGVDPVGLTQVFDLLTVFEYSILNLISLFENDKVL